MKTEHLGRNPKAYWPKKLVPKWLSSNPKAGGGGAEHEKPSHCFNDPTIPGCSDGEVPESSTLQQHPHPQAQQGHRSSRRRKSCSDKDDALFMSCGDLSVVGEGEGWSSDPGGDDSNPNQTASPLPPPPEPVTAETTPTTSSTSNTTSTRTKSQKLRMFVGTWNVGGRAPHAGLNLRDWLCTPAPADIYVLGFQEVVPLNAGNVLVAEDKGPAARWLSLISKALNCPKRACSMEPGGSSSDSSSSSSSAAHPDQFPRPRVSFSDLISIEDMLEEEEEYDAWWDAEEDEDYCGLGSGGDDVAGKTGRDARSNNPEEPSSSSSSDDDAAAAVAPIRSPCRRVRRTRKYCLVASKQMVGVFLCVWVRADLQPDVVRVKVSCVARGIMGYMGNKGSISISMTLRQTTFCFVCTHLASGEKEKDEVRRNSDVLEILKRTRFLRSRKLAPSLAPKSILQHGKVIWLGDLNYRLASTRSDTHELLQKNDWGALLEKDQLRLEQRAGRVFSGWQEGRIYFPPTYKYFTNSDRYVVHKEQNNAKSREKKRTPAWCDRILWRGDGMKQICYVRGESRFSDHRPVYSIFSVRVDGEPKDSSGKEICAPPTNTAAGSSAGGGDVVNNNSNSNYNKGYRIKWPNIKAIQASTTIITAQNHRHRHVHGSGSGSGPSTSARIQAEEMFPITRTLEM